MFVTTSNLSSDILITDWYTFDLYQRINANARVQHLSYVCALPMAWYTTWNGVFKPWIQVAEVLWLETRKNMLLISGINILCID